MASIYLTGNSSGTQQSAVLEIPSGKMLGSPDTGDFLGIGTQWNTAEFNVFGASGGSEADLNLGAVLVVRTSVENETTNAPTCQPTGFTAESNNLNLVPPCCTFSGTPPGIYFWESNLAVPTPTCSLLASCTVLQECSGAVYGVCYDGLILNQPGTDTRHLERQLSDGSWIDLGLADPNPAFNQLTEYRICDAKPDGSHSLCSQSIAYTPVVTSCPIGGGGGGGGGGQPPGKGCGGVGKPCPIQ
ncbi:MAG: hypothetical protein JO361_02030 [Gammaproteobacteria bacterium]|nr:hypothetical protein [Gammaproteobacteria bacterium]